MPRSRKHVSGGQRHDAASAAEGEGFVSEQSYSCCCDIAHSLDRMQCSGCKRMRYRTETPFGDIGGYLWGEPCVCDPRPPTVAEAAVKP